MKDKNLLHADVTERVIKAFFHVYNTLGHGFLEKVYENALKLTLRKGDCRSANNSASRYISRVRKSANTSRI